MKDESEGKEGRLRERGGWGEGNRQREEMECRERRREEEARLVWRGTDSRGRRLSRRGNRERKGGRRLDDRMMRG